MKFKHLLPWLVFVTLLVLWGYMHFGHAGSGDSPVADTVYKRDTLWKRYDTVIKKTMVVKEVIHDSIPVAFNPHPDYDTLKEQYNALLKEFAARNIYLDSLKIDSFGYVLVNDTVQFNKLGIRSYTSNYKLPTIIDTVIINKPAPVKGELYYGVGLAAGKFGVDVMHLGLLYKNKNNHISGVYVGVTPDFRMTYGIQTYWKISRKK